MSVKDKYGNNLRRGRRVRSLIHDDKREGVIVGTDSSANTALVQWDDGDEGTEKGENLVATERAFRR